MKKTFSYILVALTLVAFFLMAVGSEETNTPENTAEKTSTEAPADGIIIGKSAVELNSMNKDEVYSYLNDLGFENVTFSPVYDLIIGWLTKDGDVDKVEINGVRNFSSSDSFAKDCEIVIFYHTFSENESEESSEWTVTPDGKIQVGKKPSDFAHKNKDAVGKLLTEMGFENIKYSPICDLIFGWLTSDGEVDRVSINGKTDYSAKDSFDKNTEIIIYYHTFSEDSTTTSPTDTVKPEGKIQIGKKTSDFHQMDKEEVAKLLTELGFSDITYSPITDLITGWLTKDGSVEDVSINGRKDYKKDEFFAPDSKVIIFYHTFEGDFCTNGLQHTWVTDQGKPATCTEAGLSDGEHCSVCGKVQKAQETLPPAHTVVIDKAVPATESSTGLSEGSHCSACGAVLKEQTVTYWSITVENNPEFAALFSKEKPYTYAQASDFANKYRGERIEFDCSLDYMEYSKPTSETIFDFLFTYGDYNANTSVGPVFKVDDANVFSYKITDSNKTLTVTENLHIVAEVESFNSNTGLFFIELEQVTHRTKTESKTAAVATESEQKAPTGSLSAISLTGSNIYDELGKAIVLFGFDQNKIQTASNSSVNCGEVEVYAAEYGLKMWCDTNTNEILYCALVIADTKDKHHFISEMSMIESTKYDLSKASSWISKNIGTNNSTTIDGVKYIFTTSDGMCSLQIGTKLFFDIMG